MGPPALLLALAILATLSWAGDALDMKLTAQFARFDAAKATLAERTGRQGQEIDRDTWEQLLKPPPAEQLAPAELHELHDRHLAEAAAARESARKKSAIDLDRFRTNRNEVMRFCQKFPKGGLLHVHPTGVISPESAKGILSRTNPRIDSGLAYFARQSGAKGVEFLDHLKPTPFNDLTEDQKTRIARMVQTPDAAPGSPVRLSMNDFDGYFPFIKTVLQKSADDFDPVYQSYVDFLKRARSQGVTYVELTKGFVVAPDSLQRVKVLSERLLKDTGVIVRWNLAFNRLDGPGTFRSQAQELSKLVASSPGATMVGIDLIGNEDGTPAFDRAQTLYAPLLDGEKNHGSRLGRTMHAGEAGDARDPRDALLLGAQRLGHGVRLAGDPVALEYARRKGVGIEANLTSNLVLGSVKDLHQHPFLQFLRLGLKVSLSTDDEGIFGTDIARECMAAIQNTDICFEELKELSRNSLRTAFLPASEKADALAAREKSFAGFETGWQTAHMDGTTTPGADLPAGRTPAAVTDAKGGY